MSKHHSIRELTDGPFKPGDLVRLTSGAAALIVRRCLWHKHLNTALVEANYRTDLNGALYGQIVRAADKFTLFETDETKEIEIPMTNKLYQTLEAPPRFGTFLIHNSAGKVVLEMKGGDKNVEAFDPNTVEEVRPYTVAAASAGNTYHYITVKGAVAKNDVIVTSSGIILHITKLDTKSSKVMGVLKGRKMVTEALELPATGTTEDEEQEAA